MIRNYWWIFIIPLLFVFSNVYAQGDDLKEVNRKLRKKLAAIEDELEEIKQVLKQTSPSYAKKQKVREDLQKENVAIEKEDPDWFGVESRFKVKFYGYIKVDLAYDTARSFAGNFGGWVESEHPLVDDDDQFNFTARQTRFGVEIRGPVIGQARTSGRVEVDFYKGADENSNEIRMRHAYLTIEWPQYNFSILAGQTWDLVGPLNPPTVTFAPLWWAGNPGFRRPQLRFTKALFLMIINCVWKLPWPVLIGDGRDLGIEPVDSGEDSGFPTIQSRLSLSVPSWTEKPLVLGFGGHWGQEQYDINNAGDDENFVTWSLLLDFVLPLATKLELQGELWVGKNMDTYGASIGQGVNTVKLKAISAMGGWLALCFGPFGDWNFNIGASVDDPQDSDLNVGDRERNYAAFVNTYYKLHFVPGLLVALEVSYWNTQYKSGEDGDSLRLQGAFFYKF